MFKKIMLGLIGILVIVGVVFLCYEESHKADDENDKYVESIEISDGIKMNVSLIDVSKYERLSNKITLKKIDFEGIDNNQKKDFLNRQEEKLNHVISILDNYMAYLEEGGFETDPNSDFVTTDMVYSYYNDILTVKVIYAYPSEIGPTCESLNIFKYAALENRTITNTEMISMMGYDISKVVDEIYTEFGKNPYVMKASDRTSKEILSDVYVTKDEVYKERILNGINALNMDIKDDKVQMHYMLMDMFNTLSCEYGIGALFQYATYEFNK